MKRYKNLTLIGTSHIAIESVKEVENILLNVRPEIVALELDKSRFAALLSKKKSIKLRDIRSFGIKGFLVAVVISWIEKKLGEHVGVPPGSEMKKAVKLARETKAEIALIDQNVKLTLRRLIKKLTWKEKFRFLIDLFKGIILRKKEIESFDLRKVPPEKIIKKLISKVKKRYPNFYLVLVKERNEFMAKNLYNLMHTNKSIVAVVGAGHEIAIINLIKKLE